MAEKKIKAYAIKDGVLGQAHPLGRNSHSGSGIMRANVDVRALQLQSFDERQARAIRATLNDDPRPTAR